MSEINRDTLCHQDRIQKLAATIRKSALTLSRKMNELKLWVVASRGIKDKRDATFLVRSVAASTAIYAVTHDLDASAKGWQATEVDESALRNVLPAYYPGDYVEVGESLWHHQSSIRNTNTAPEIDSPGSCA